MHRDHGVKRVILAAVVSVTLLIFVGYVLVLMNPPSELDKKCLNKSLVEMNTCISEFYRGKQ